MKAPMIIFGRYMKINWKDKSTGWEEFDTANSYEKALYLKVQYMLAHRDFEFKIVLDDEYLA